MTFNTRGRVSPDISKSREESLMFQKAMELYISYPFIVGLKFIVLGHMTP